MPTPITKARFVEPMLLLRSEICRTARHGYTGWTVAL
jgi:hypothetical protein